MNIQTSNQNRINFTSNFRLISGAGYDKIAAMPITKVVNEMKELSDLVQVNRIVATGDVIACLAGVVKDVAKNIDYFYHWYSSLLVNRAKVKTPKLRTIETFWNDLIQNNNTKGAIIGGITKKHRTIEGKWSRRMMKVLKKPINESKGADFTIFFAQKTRSDDFVGRPRAFLAYDKKTDTYYLNCRKYFDVDNYVDVLDKQGLRDFFKTIKISDNDKVFIGKEQIPNDFLNKSKH